MLADLLGGLTGEPLVQFQASLDSLLAGISDGRFSLAWQYPRVIEEGAELLAEQRRAGAEAARAQRALEGRRKRAADGLRDSAGRLPPEAMARLNRSLRAAATADEIDAVAVEIEQSVSAARNTEDRRRDREIDRTRSKIRRAVPRGNGSESSNDESWQDVLRRFAESQASE